MVGDSNSKRRLFPRNQNNDEAQCISMPSMTSCNFFEKNQHLSIFQSKLNQNEPKLALSCEIRRQVWCGVYSDNFIPFALEIGTRRESRGAAVTYTARIRSEAHIIQIQSRYKADICQSARKSFGNTYSYYNTNSV